MNVPETERCKDLVERVLHAESKEIMPVTEPRTACIVFIEALKQNHADIVYEIHNHPIPAQSTITIEPAQIIRSYQNANIGTVSQYY